MKFTKARIFALVIALAFLLLSFLIYWDGQKFSGDLAICSGKLWSEEPAIDPDFGVVSPNFFLHREVEFYQVLSLSDEGYPLYGYSSQKLKDLRVDYEDLNEAFFSLLGTVIPERFDALIEDHSLSDYLILKNPDPDFPYRSKDFYEPAEVGDSGFKLSSKLLDYLNSDSYYTATRPTPRLVLTRELPLDLPEDLALIKRDGRYFTRDSDPRNPQVGDIRITYYTIDTDALGPVTCGGELKDGLIGGSNFLIYDRQMSDSEFIAAARKTKKSGAIVPMIIALITGGIAIARSIKAKKSA
ncbi:MAG: hypothetical protein Q4P08_06725 [Eubacteriales bacterium]|nr:hypothetical protein [Eubacteriales bacterium]